MWRQKAAFGDALRSRKWVNQQHEALLRAQILNTWVTPKTCGVRHSSSTVINLA